MNTASDQTSPRSPECNITRIHTTTPLARRACSRWCAQHALCLSDIAPPQGVSSPSSCAWKRQQHGSNRHELAVVVTPPHPPLPSPINGPHNVPDDTGRRVCLHKLRLDVGLGDLNRTAPQEPTRLLPVRRTNSRQVLLFDVDTPGNSTRRSAQRLAAVGPPCTRR